VQIEIWVASPSEIAAREDEEMDSRSRFRAGAGDDEPIDAYGQPYSLVVQLPVAEPTADEDAEDVAAEELP